MFTVENKEYSIIKFVINDPFTIEDLQKILGIISSIFEMKKPFAFYVDCININLNISLVPSLSKILISWLKNNKNNIIKSLQCSALIITSKIFADILNGVFKIHPLVKPNIITTNSVVAEQFVTKTMKEYLGKNT